MNQLQAAIKLYKEAIQDAAHTLARSHLVMAFLLAAFIVTLLAYPVLSQFGIVGGFALGMMEAWIAGWYLALVEIGVSSRRKITVDDIRECSGVYFWEVISVLFLFFIARLLLMGTPSVLFIVIPVATVLFNPAPEMIYLDRTQSVDLLGRAIKFMQENWPEWLGGHLLPFTLLTAWAYAMTGEWSSQWILSAMTLFGPWFEFVKAGSLAILLGGTGLVGFLSFFGIFLFVHGVMLFRGHLYKRLRHSSRRSRAWQARL